MEGFGLSNKRLKLEMGSPDGEIKSKIATLTVVVEAFQEGRMDFFTLGKQHALQTYFISFPQVVQHRPCEQSQGMLTSHTPTPPPYQVILNGRLQKVVMRT